MATSSDYLKLADETKDVILEYAVQDWPVVKNSVSLFNDSQQYMQLVARIIAMLQFALDGGGSYIMYGNALLLRLWKIHSGGEFYMWTKSYCLICLSPSLTGLGFKMGTAVWLSEYS